MATMRRMAATSLAELVEFEATDGLILPGLLYEPRKRTDVAAVFLHGNGDSSIFYSSRRMNGLAAALTRAGIAFLPFNNRGAHLAKNLTRRVGREKEQISSGMTYELIRECVPDIDGAFRFLKSRGYREIHLIGHSSGASKICVYNESRPRNRFASYILLAGGDDMGIYFDALGPKRFASVLERARNAVKIGRGAELIPRGISPFLISWSSLFDTINPEGQYNVFPFFETLHALRLTKKARFAEFSRISKRALAVYGSEDEFCFSDVSGCVEILKSHASARTKFEIIDGAGHSFRGFEQDLGKVLVRWIAGAKAS